MNLTQTGIGAVTASLLPTENPQRVLQVDAPADAATTFSLQGRLDDTADWVELATGTADVLQTIPATPQVRLEVTAGTGTVTALLSDAQAPIASS